MLVQKLLSFLFMCHAIPRFLESNIAAKQPFCCYFNRKWAVCEAKKDLFFDFDEKKELVTKNLKDISKHLFQLRQSVPNSRLCVGNQSLIKNTTKYGVTITKSQDKFISSIAFGSTLEKLKEGNYEETERLLFVPQCKMVKK